MPSGRAPKSVVIFAGNVGVGDTGAIGQVSGHQWEETSEVQGAEDESSMGASTAVGQAPCVRQEKDRDTADSTDPHVWV